MRNPDGTGTCDRCGITLEGFGVLYGMVSADLTGERIREQIFCYRNQCRTVMLAGMLAFAGSVDCTHCDQRLTARSVTEAMLVTDIQPATRGDVQRTMQFCYSNGSRDAFMQPLTMRGRG